MPAAAYRYGCQKRPVCIKFLQLLPQSLHCISIAVAVASRKFLYLHPGNFFSLYFSVLPELLLLVDSRKIHNDDIFFFCHSAILPRREISRNLCVTGILLNSFSEHKRPGKDSEKSSPGLSLYKLLKLNKSQALLTEPNSSIFSLTVALIASNQGARSLRGSYPLPCSSLPSSMYLRVAAANASWHSVFTLILDTPRSIAFLIISAGIPVPP